MALTYACLPMFRPLYSFFPHCTGVGKCAQQHTGEVVLSHVWDEVVKDAVSDFEALLLASSFRPLTLGKARPHVTRTLTLLMGRPTQEGTEVCSQKPERNWDLTSTMGMSLTADSSASVKPRDNCIQPKGWLQPHETGDLNQSAEPLLDSDP